MESHNIFSGDTAFAVLQTTERSQTSVMILHPGESSSEAPSRHPKSDQILLLVEGSLTAEIGSSRRDLRPGDSVIVEANTPHRFTNSGDARAVTFSVYAPPAYPPGTKEE
jgi:mannose-6-phosphate isomerase-like protein (cupin superfamily)